HGTIPDEAGGVMVQVQLLGAVAAARDDGVPVQVGPAKCRAVLATLALSVGESVTVSRLVDVVWGSDPPRTAAKTLQGYIADLRKLLGAETIMRSGAAYRLALPTEAVDVARFRRLIGAGQMQAALAEWTGPPLTGLDSTALDPAVDALIEQWLGAMESDLRDRLADDAPGTVATLTQLTTEYPFREEIWALLMTALYRSGRQTDALAAYQRARRHL